MGKHSGQQDPSEQQSQAAADEFDAAQAAIDAQAEQNKTDYPALQAYEKNQKK